MPKPSPAAAQHLRENKQTILNEWEKQVRAKITDANRHSSAALRDAIPIFLDRLFADWSEEQKNPALQQGEQMAAAEHGVQRANLGDYTTDDVVHEYEVLRQVLLAVLEINQPVHAEDREAIVRAIFAAVRRAIAEFAGAENERRQSFEKSLQSQLQQLTEERELREKFVSLLTHDLRNPLAAARMSAELLLRQRDDAVALDRLSGRIIDGLDRADGMIRNLLDANRIKAGERLPITVTPCKLNLIVRNTLDELTSVYGNRFKFEEGAEIEGYWDADALRRILENVCGNAIKYGAKDRDIELRVRSLGEEGRQVEICVHNDGNPIAPEDLESLFEHFRRAKTAHSEGKRGWGIGLTLVRGIADAHGGTVTVESSAEAGTIFCIVLPRDCRNAAF